MSLFHSSSNLFYLSLNLLVSFCGFIEEKKKSAEKKKCQAKKREEKVDCRGLIHQTLLLEYIAR
ncbi:MAG: hypothetical protein JSV88_14185 [Candidatus Aminicenantes bacterium]|nr:MAG: hypothetical protein JSV88_14185 [Candidatus Aminicenantes bacterium]